MKRRKLVLRFLVTAIVFLVLTVSGCDLLGFGQDGSGSETYDEATGTYTVRVSETEGATIEHPDGVIVTIPPDALSRDTDFVIQPTSEPDAVSRDGSLGLSPSYKLSIGDAVAIGEITIQIPYPVSLFQERDVFQTDHMLLGHGREDGSTWIRPVAEIDRQRGLVISESISEALNSKDESVRTFVVVYMPPLTLVEPTPIMAVPYYWQDFLPWCVPTSLSMVLNYHDGGLAGTVSNYFLAGNNSHDANSGANPVAQLRDSGASEDFFDTKSWDADLIPDNPFTAYVKRITQGYNLQDLYGSEIDMGFITVDVPDEEIPPRPVNLISDTTWHAFNAVGTSEDSIWLHDSSGAFTGGADIAEEQSWATFRSIAVDNTQTTELWTTVINHDVRPYAERTGSIELSEGSGTGYIKFLDSDGNDYAVWQWDGDPYDNGYFWSEGAGYSLTNDSTYGNRISPILGLDLEYSVRVNNVTAVERTYTLDVEVVNTATNSRYSASSHQVTVGAYSRGSYITDFFNADKMGAGEYAIRFWLDEGNTSLDVKSVRFIVE